MASELYLTLKKQVDDNTKAIEELKEAFSSLGSAETISSLQDLQGRVSNIITDMQNCRDVIDFQRSIALKKTGYEDGVLSLEKF